MTNGQILLVAFLLGAALAMAAMLAIALSTLGRTTNSSVREDRTRVLHRWWLIAVLTAAIAAFIISTRWFPYPTVAEGRSFRHFTVVAQQYHFQVPSEIPVNTHIIFDVTSVDVNHGFGIYDPKGALLGQVQAMPNYINHLPFYFRRTGRYTIRCLEYCGIGHPAMLASFRVR